MSVQPQIEEMPGYLKARFIGAGAVIALTAYGQTEDRIRALMAGLQTHVAKPVEPVELAIVIANLAKRPNREGS